MATSITTQADLVTYGDVTDNEIERLTTERMRANNWSREHQRAWSEVLRQLALRPTAIEEDDLGDTDELKRATIYMVLHYAYEQAELNIPGSQGRAGLYWDRAIRELSELELTLASGGTAGRSSYGFRRAVRV